MTQIKAPHDTAAGVAGLSGIQAEAQRRDHDQGFTAARQLRVVANSASAEAQQAAKNLDDVNTRLAAINALDATQSGQIATQGAAITTQGSAITTLTGQVAALPVTLAALHDVDASTATTGQVLYKDASGVFKFMTPATGGGGGSALPYPVGGVPLLSALTWLNQGVATAVQNADGSLTLQRVGGGSNLSILHMAAPATPYVWTIGFIPHLYLSGFPSTGMALVDSASSSCYIHSIFGNGGVVPVIQSWTGATSFSGNDLITDAILVPTPIYQRITDDGVNRTYAWSSDGVNFDQIYTNTSTHWITPNKIGIEVNAVSSAMKVGMTLVYWNVA